MRLPRRGFILPLTLVLLAVSAAALAGVCRSSLRNALSAGDEAEALQRRWGVLSCQAAFLPRAEGVLQGAEARTRRPAASVDATVLLGGQRFDLRFGDEQAKLNLNPIYLERGRSEAERAARIAARPAGGRLRVELAPARPPRRALAESDDEPPVDPFSSFGQVYAFDDGPATFSSLYAASASITCWGDGKLNWRRTSAAALQARCEPALGKLAVQKLLALQSLVPPPALADVFASQSMPPPGGAVYANVLTEHSNCHSLWIASSSRGRHVGGGRVRYDLAIVEAGGEAKTICFSEE